MISELISDHCSAPIWRVTIEIPSNNISSLSFLTNWLVLCGAFLVEKDGTLGRTDRGATLVLGGTFLLVDHITDILLLGPADALIHILTVFLTIRGTLLFVAGNTLRNTVGNTGHSLQ